MKDKEKLLFLIEGELSVNNNKLSLDFIQGIVDRSEVIHLHPTPNMRLCILRLPSGHEVLGKAQVLDTDNDVEQIGKYVAMQDAVNQLWGVCGNIAKALMEVQG